MGHQYIIITVKDDEQSQKVINVLTEAEENGELDFAFGCRTEEHLQQQGEDYRPFPGLPDVTATFKPPVDAFPRDDAALENAVEEAAYPEDYPQDE